MFELDVEANVVRMYLRNGTVILLDPDEHARIDNRFWSFSGGYCVHWLKGNQLEYLHRTVNRTPNGLQTDHVNKIRTDCRKSNLRSVTQSENHHNRTMYKNNRSGFVGVHQEGTQWVMQIQANGKRRKVRGFDTAEAAAKAYDAMKRTWHPTAPRDSYNFPDEQLP